MALPRGIAVVFVLVFLIVLGCSPILAQNAVYTDLYHFSCGLDQNGQNIGPCFPFNPGILAQGIDGNIYGMACDTWSRCNNGSIFRMTPGGVITVLKRLDGQTGSSSTQVPGPVSGLTLGPNGNLYGVTRNGGAGFGSIFQLDVSTNPPTINTIYSFDENAGAPPIAPPVVGDDGYLYGTLGTSAYRINTSGGDFHVWPAVLPGESYSPLLLASDGNFYGTIPQGNGSNGDPTGHGAVFQMTQSGVVTNIYYFPSSASEPFEPKGSRPYGGLVEGADGNLYGVNSSGGSATYINQGVFTYCDGCGTVFQLPKSLASVGWVYPFDGFGGTPDGAVPVANLIAANDGNLYGSASAFGCSGEGCLEPGAGTLFYFNTNGNFSLDFTFSCTLSIAGCYGAEPLTNMQATSGIIYGMTNQGGYDTSGSGPNQGVFYSLNPGPGVKPFVSTIQPAGHVGQTIGIIGQGFNSASGVWFNGLAASFNVVSDTYLTATVPVGATTGPLAVFTSNAPNGMLTTNRNFRLLQTLAPKATLSTSGLAFGNQLVGAASSSQSITLTNDGNAALSISSITASGDFSLTSNCPISPTTLAINASCTINVVFTPSASGARSGSVTITDNASGSPQSVTLSGNGTDFSMSLTPSSQAVKQGKSAKYALTVAAVSGFSGTVALACSGAPAASTCGVLPASVTLNGNGSSSATVTVTTTAGKKGTPKGSYVLKITGTARALGHNVSAGLTVQ